MCVWARKAQTQTYTKLGFRQKIWILIWVWFRLDKKVIELGERSQKCSKKHASVLKLKRGSKTPGLSIARMLLISEKDKIKRKGSKMLQKPPTCYKIGREEEKLPICLLQTCCSDQKESREISQKWPSPVNQRERETIWEKTLAQLFEILGGFKEHFTKIGIKKVLKLKFWKKKFNTD